MFLQIKKREARIIQNNFKKTSEYLFHVEAHFYITVFEKLASVCQPYETV